MLRSYAERGGWVAEQKAAQLVFLVAVVEVRSESRHMGANWL